jgi:hypothetical protein
MMKKNRNNQPAAGVEAAKWRQAFRETAKASPGCPEPEQVIGAALQELAAAEHQQIQDHLLTCRDCLELYLDVRSAQDEAEPAAVGKVNGIVAEKPLQTWLAVWGRKVRETLRALGKPKRLVPALAAVSLVVMVFILGREEKTRVLPHPDLAMEKQGAPAAPPSVAPSQELEARKSIPAPLGSGLIAVRPQAETAGLVKKKSLPASRALAAPIRLDIAAVPDNGARLSYRADQDAFAYLLREDRDGKFSLLDSRGIEADKTYYYPDRDQRPKPDAADTKTTVFLVASPAPVADVKTRLKELDRTGKNQIQALFPKSTIRSLAVRLP